ncbi:MAG: hypothetical protein NT029_08295 [Armatimonadetes bacterium]|nr:hypothetical protein [Armatimonadota bacterium]
MRHYVDTSVVIVLHVGDLWRATLQALGTSISHLWLLQGEVCSLCAHDSELESAYDRATLAGAARFAHTAQPVCDAPDPEEHAYLTNADRIDGGEAALFAATKSAPGDFRLLTADVNSLQALTTAAGCVGVEKRLEGRVLVLEQIVERLLARVGMEPVAAGLREAGRGCGAARLIVTKAGDPMTEAGLKAALSRRIEEIRRQTGRLLA